MRGRPSSKCCNNTFLSPPSRGGPRSRTTLRPKTNVGNTAAAVKSALVLCQFVFNQYNLESSHSIPTNDVGGNTPPVGAGATPTAKSPTDTSTPKNATPTAIRGGKKRSNRIQPMYSIGAESKLAAYPDSDIILSSSSGISDTNSDYSELRKNSPSRSDNCQELEAQIHELGKINNEVRTELEEISSPRVLFTQPLKLDLT